MQYQEINELLAKGIKKENMSADDAREVESANGFLVNGIGQKPAWLDEFFSSNRYKLVETICRATSVSGGISSLHGYKEGYFNEIVQNANDLHCGECINITTKKNGAICNLVCQYDDKGFELSNIYAFLNREMSDKNSDDSQTGKFGVGIKSFFKFVDRMSIHSNILLDFCIKRMDGDNDVFGNVDINEHWDGKHTSLEIVYNTASETEFNIKKLTNLIDYLNGLKEIDPQKAFVTGNDNELVFDIRSLIFMRINSKNEKVISDLRFEGSQHNIEISCIEKDKIKSVIIDEGIWKIGTVMLAMSVDNNVVCEKKYIVFSHNNITTAFPVGVDLIDNNRMYSTYYLKESSNKQLLSIGMLVDSEYANMQRNDVGDSEESINKVYWKVREHLKILYGCMCAKEISAMSCLDEISDVFHNLLARYITVDKNEYWESPLEDAHYNNQYLPKIKNEKVCAYVVYHSSKEEYENSAYKEGDIAKELREHYFDYIERSNVHDLDKLLANPNCLGGVKKIYTILYEKSDNYLFDNIKNVSRIVNYFYSVAEFLGYVISEERREGGKVTDAEVDRWLIRLRNEIGKYYNPIYFLKIVGRYKLNNAISYDGTICHTNLSFKDYLFNGILSTEEGILAKYQNEQFDERYKGLKEELLRKRYTDLGNSNNKYSIRCMRPTGRSVAGWDGTYDYYYMIEPVDGNSELSQPELLLEKMATDENFKELRVEGNRLSFFEKYARGMWNREKQFKYYITIEQQIIDLSCIKNIKLDSFSKFISAVKHRCNLVEELKAFINISCEQKNISTLDIVKEVLPVMVEIPDGDKKTYLLDEFASSDVRICGITEQSNNEIQKENSAFIYKMTGYKIHLYRFASNTRRRMIVYFGNGKCAVRTESSKPFREVAQYVANQDDIYIFYDNFAGNLQDLVTIVLEDMGTGIKELELLKGYIHNGNNLKTMSYMSRRRNLAKVKKKLVLDWADIECGDVSFICDNEMLYRLLTARGSYDVFCPICADIPLEIFDYGEENKKRHSRYIIVLENENPDTKKDVPYIITVACSYCFKRLRSTLSKSEFDGKNMILTTQIAHGQHEKMRSKQLVELSPVNVELMKKFKLE